MTGYLTHPDGSRTELPVLLQWKLEYASGTPCDSFWLCFAGEESWAEALHQAVGFVGEEDGERIFTGLLDEYSLSQSAEGWLVEISGRGMAARLLDNEAESADYLNATTQVILANHVTPYGVSVAETGTLSAVPLFSVSAGSSEWTVLEDFCLYYNGVEPWFDRNGELHLCAWPESSPLALDESVPVTELRRTEQRYGVLSAVLLRYRSTPAVVRLEDAAFLAEGGCARRVVTLPQSNSYQALRYSGQYQLEQSRKDRYLIEVTIPLPFWGWPGELVQLERGCSWDGLWRVRQSSVSLNEQGLLTVLTLEQTDFSGEKE